MKNPLSILMIIQTYFPKIGGAEKQCLQLSKSLKERGHNVRVFTEHWKGRRSYEVIDGIPVRRIGRGGPRFFHSVIFMISIFFYLLWTHRRFHIYHAHLAASHAVMTALMGRIFGRRAVVTIGGGNIIGEIDSSRKTFMGRMKLRALGVLKPEFIVLSKEMKSQLKGFGLEKISTHLIQNGVDLGTYHGVSNSRKQSIRTQLGWNGLIFLYTGRFSEDKITVEVFKNFVAAWARAIQDRRDVHFILMGQGPLEAEYQRIIEQHNLSNSIHIKPPENDIYLHYQAADIFVLPSITEGVSNSLLEAMASQLPILASRVSGIKEMIKEEAHGLLFDPFSSEEIEKCIKRMINDPEFFKSLGKNCEEMALKNSIGKAVDLHLSLYNEK